MSSITAEDDTVVESEREPKVLPIFQVVKFPVSLPKIYLSVILLEKSFLSIILPELLGRIHCQKYLFRILYVNVQEKCLQGTFFCLLE